MILFQVRDLAAHSCGEPHVAPSWEIAKASLGAMLAKTSELAERASSIRVDYVCDWDPENGLLDVKTTYLDSESGDVCLAEFRAACRREEDEKQAEAEMSNSGFKSPASVIRESLANAYESTQEILKEQAKNVRYEDLPHIDSAERRKKVSNSADRNHQIMLEHAAEEEDDE